MGQTGHANDGGQHPPDTQGANPGAMLADLLVSLAATGLPALRYGHGHLAA